MNTIEQHIRDLESVVASDPAASFWLKQQVEITKTRDVLDALSDAETLVRILKSRLDALMVKNQNINVSNPNNDK